MVGVGDVDPLQEGWWTRRIRLVGGMQSVRRRYGERADVSDKMNGKNFSRLPL